jgi:hypothetical protein
MLNMACTRGRPEVAPPQPDRSSATTAVLAAVFVLAAALTWWSMPTGPLSSNDSITYLGVAHNVAAGRGITSPFAFDQTGLSPEEGAARLGAEPMTSWPPLYPLVLAAGTPLGLTVESMSRLVNVVACGATAVLTALLARRLGASTLAGAGAGVAVVVTGAAALTFAAVATETLFLPLSLVALVNLARAAGREPTDPSRRAALAVFVASASAAALTRHAGFALVATGMIVLARRDAGPRPVRRVLVVGSLTAAVPALALAWARSQPGWRAGPSFQDRWDELLTPASSVAHWFAPGDGPATAATVAVVVVVAAAAVGAGVAVIAAGRRTLEAPMVARERRTALVVAAVYAVAYVGVVTLSGWWLDRNVPFLDWRLALPLAPVTMAVLAAGAEAAVRLAARRSPRSGGITFALVTVAALAIVTANAVHTSRHVWTRAVSGVWAAPTRYPTMRAVTGLPDQVLVFANQPSAVYALSGRPVLTLPLRHSTMTGAPNPNAERDLGQLVALLAGGRAVVVLERAAVSFFARNGQPLATEQQLRARFPLTVLAEDDRFVILGSAQWSAVVALGPQIAFERRGTVGVGDPPAAGFRRP